MKNLIKPLIIFLALGLSAMGCNKDDDDPSEVSDNFSEYFTCKINGVPFSGRSNFNCSGRSFYYYPAGAGGPDNAYMLISGRNCDENMTVALRFYNPDIPALGAFDFLSPEFADSTSPGILHIISGDGVYKFEKLIGGEMNIDAFTSRDSTTMAFGRLEGTFQFSVSNEEIDSTVHVTDGVFRFKVPNFW